MNYALVTIIISLSAIIAPVITTLINGFFQLKAKKIKYQQHLDETYYLHYRDIIEEFLKSAGYSTHCSAPSEEYEKYYALMLNVSSEPIRDKLLGLNDALYSHRNDRAKQILESIAMELLIPKFPENAK